MGKGTYKEFYAIRRAVYCLPGGKGRDYSVRRELCKRVRRGKGGVVKKGCSWRVYPLLQIDWRGKGYEKARDFLLRGKVLLEE